MKRRAEKSAKKTDGGGDLPTASYLQLLGDRVRMMRSRRAMSPCSETSSAAMVW